MGGFPFQLLLLGSGAFLGVGSFSTGNTLVWVFFVYFGLVCFFPLFPAFHCAFLKVGKVKVIMMLYVMIIIFSVSRLR